MLEILALFCVVACIALGFFVMRKIDDFMIENQRLIDAEEAVHAERKKQSKIKNMESEEAAGTPVYRKVSGDTMAQEDGNSEQNVLK